MASTPVRRRRLLVEVAVFALPTTILLPGLIGMIVLLMLGSWPGAAMGTEYAGGRSPAPVPLIVLVLSGLVGLAGFWRIAGAALLGHDVRAIGMPWWLMMTTGMLLAVAVCAVAVVEPPNTTPDKLWQWLFVGPALLVPATHLLVERRAA